MKTLLLVGWMWPGLLLAGDASPRTLDALVDNREVLWQQAPDAFLTANRALGFQWTTNTKEAARTARPGLTFLDMPVYETVMRFDKAVPTEVILSLYNRGDAGKLDEAGFQKLTQAVNT